MPTAPTLWPLGPPTVSGTTLTVDQALQTPSVITRDIARLANQQFFANRIFSDGGTVNGGAVLYELPPTTATDLFADRNVQEVEPGAEFPILTFQRGVPVVAKPRKIGGKFPVTKEAARRNSVRLVQRAMMQTANTIALALDQLAMSVLDAAITGNSRTSAGQSWATAAGITNLNASGTNQAFADMLIARQTIELEMRGQTLDSIIMHPNQELSLSEAAARGNTTIGALLATAGIRNWFVSPRVPAGSAYLYQEGQVGGWANEFPLDQEVWYEPDEQTTWYQWSISPAMYVDNPYAILKLTGIA